VKRFIAVGLVWVFMLGAVVVNAAEKKSTKTGTAKKAAPEKWVAKINDKYITLEEFESRWNAIPFQYKYQYGLFGPEGKIRVLDTLVKNELLYQEGIKKGILNSETITQRIEDLKKQVVAEELLTRQMKGLEANDSEAMSYYNANKQEFGEPEQVRVRHILVKAETEANEVLAKLKKGEDLAKLAPEYSIDPGTKDKGGELGFFSRGQMVPEFEEAAFGLKVGERSGAIKTAYGYHIIESEEKKEGSQKSFDEVKEEAKNAAFQEKQRKLFEAYLEELGKKADVQLKQELLQ